VLTASDRVSRGEGEDESGPTAIAILAGLGFDVDWEVVPDEPDQIEAVLRKWIDEDFALIVTTGGTGFSERDVTPEVTSALIDRPAPGLVEAARAAHVERFPHTMLSRAVSGIAGRTLIINLPGSTKGVEEWLEVIKPALMHGVGLLRGRPVSH
jgi:molybdenum cofactor synthesis domain-containing protein